MSHFKGFFTNAPKPFSDNLEFSRTFAKMWIAGTMGAYFTFLFRNLAFDVPTFSFPGFECAYTLDVFIRYFYLFWFLAYFFASNVRHEGNKEIISWWDVGFNVAQASASFGAAYFLGFLTRSDTLLSHERSCAVEAANGAIALICIFSLIGFGYREDEKKREEEEKRKKEADRKQLNCLRWWGFGSSSLAVGVEVVASSGKACWALTACAVVFSCVPFIALAVFIGIEWRREPSVNPAAASSDAKQALSIAEANTAAIDKLNAKIHQMFKTE